MLVFNLTRCPISAAAHREWCFLASPEAAREHYWVRSRVARVVAWPAGWGGPPPQVLLVREGRSRLAPRHHAQRLKARSH